ncbi:MAG: hypothetical protein ACI8O8_001369 [Oleiphilaceae bacterium]|jgi:hypothetical protein
MHLELKVKKTLTIKCLLLHKNRFCNERLQNYHKLMESNNAEYDKSEETLSFYCLADEQSTEIKA